MHVSYLRFKGINRAGDTALCTRALSPSRDFTIYDVFMLVLACTLICRE